jgi:signal transduction histidine kinase
MMSPTNESPIGKFMNQETVQSVVHDLRTPITVIKGNLQLLLSGVMGQMTDEQLMLIRRSVGPLEEMILMTENLMQAATLERGEIKLKFDQVDLDRMLEETINFYSIPFKQREMRIFRDGNTFGAHLRVDSFWMKRVLNNLIWNAYKFTPDHGKVCIQVNRNAKGMEIIIEDNGRGIPADKLNTIFDKFMQAHPSVDRRMGSGLGLWICKRVLELHGGRIWVESEEERGSRFIIFLPSSCIL